MIMTLRCHHTLIILRPTCQYKFPMVKVMVMMKAMAMVRKIYWAMVTVRI